MFWSTVERTRQDLRDLQSVVAANERLRNLIFSSNKDDLVGPTGDEFDAIRHTSPTKSGWALYDHCAAVTRLYAVFEAFVDSIIKEYLEALPDIYPAYLELPHTVVNQHRIGVAQILSKLGDKGLFKHLSERDTLTGISEGNFGRPYSLLPDAFLTDTQNYRAEQINLVFSYLDISNIWAGVEKHRELIEYMKSRDVTETPRTILNKLVADRNFAAHSVVTDVMSGPELISLARFLDALVVAISEIARKKCVVLECSRGKRLDIFHVVRVFSNQIVGVRFVAGRVEVGDQLLVLGKDGAYKATVVSIRNVGTSLTSADFDKHPELGLGLDVDVGKGARLVTFHKLAPSAEPDGSQIVVSQSKGRFRTLASAIGQALREFVDPTIKVDEE
jgi:hypothetical protein